MAASSYSSSRRSSSSSLSASSSRFRGSRARPLPCRGQIKKAIFASFVKSIARFLAAKSLEESENGSNPHDGAGSQVRLRTRSSDFSMDVDGRLSADESGVFALSVGSSPVSNLSGSITPSSPFKPLSRPRSFHAGS